MNESYANRDIVRASLREPAARIATPAREPSVLVDDVLATAPDSVIEVESPLGMVYVAAGPEGVRYLAPAPSEEELACRYRERFGRFVSPATGMADLIGRVSGTLGGEPVEVPLDLSRTTPFQR